MLRTTLWSSLQINCRYNQLISGFDIHQIQAPRHLQQTLRDNCASFGYASTYHYSTSKCSPSMGLTIRDHNGKPVTHGRQRLSTGVRLHYYTAGSGPALMLQHGVRPTPSSSSSRGKDTPLTEIHIPSRTDPKDELLLAQSVALFDAKVHDHSRRHARYRRLDPSRRWLRHGHRSGRPRRTDDPSRPRDVPHVRRRLGRCGCVSGGGAVSGAGDELDLSGDAVAGLWLGGVGVIQSRSAGDASVAC